MSFNCNRSTFISFLILQLICCANCAPKSRELTTYDQKQTGEYNIQLHLKDFQIIAVVGDDSLGSLSGDYDYNYDYSDFTVKPVTPSTTTAKPQFEHKNASSTTEITSPPATSETHPTIINIELTTKQPQEIPLINIVNPTDQQAGVADILLSNNTKIQQNKKDAIAADFIHILENPSQIPVIVQDLSQHTPGSVYKNAYVDKKYEAVTNIAIVPSDDVGASTVEQELPTLGEIMHYRRCAQGFFKDKRGRCRKVRRPPQIPLGISRFASNLAARFRQGQGSENEPQESESITN